jgi:hypothetical protein
MQEASSDLVVNGVDDGQKPSAERHIVALQLEDIVAPSQACSSIEENFIKNITPKFHSGRQLSLLVVVSKASITIGRDSMKMLAEYLEKAITFETLAAEENDAKVKADLIAQAKAYRKWATERATRYGLKHPSWAKSESAGGQT